MTEMLFEDGMPLYFVGHLLAAVGAINWLLIGTMDFNLVTQLFGQGSMLTQLTYVAAGLGGLQVVGDLLEDYGVIG